MSEEWGLWEYDKYEPESMVRRRPAKEGEGFKGYVYQYFPGPDYLNALEELAELGSQLYAAVREYDPCQLLDGGKYDAIKAKEVQP